MSEVQRVRNTAGHRDRVGARWFMLFTLAWLAIWTAQLTPLQLLIPLQLNTPDDAGGWISGVAWSGCVLAVGGLAGVIVAPLAGSMSDRTRGPFGRRRPWGLTGTVLASGSLVAMSAAQGPWIVGLAWVGVSAGLAVASAAFTALIADQLTAQRGAAAAAVSSSQAGGIVVGVGAVVLLGLGLVAGYLALAGFLLVAGVAAALLLPDPPDAEASLAARRPRAVRARAAAFRDRDFSWLLGARLVVNVGNALGTALLLFFLLYGLDRDPASAQDDLLMLIVVYTVFVVVSSIIAGRVSDRSGRRIPLTVGAAVLQGAACLLVVALPAFETTLVAAALMGIGYGVYMSVGLALATHLLPSRDHSGRDLALVNVSAALGQLLGPLFGAGLVALVGGFWLMFAVGGTLSIIGGLMTLAIGRHPSTRGRRPAPR